jgi:hypothetical protein
MSGCHRNRLNFHYRSIQCLLRTAVLGLGWLLCWFSGPGLPGPTHMHKHICMYNNNMYAHTAHTHVCINTHTPLDQVAGSCRRLAASRGQEREEGEQGEGEGRPHELAGTHRAVTGLTCSLLYIYTLVGLALLPSVKEAERERGRARARETASSCGRESERKMSAHNPTKEGSAHKNLRPNSQHTPSTSLVHSPVHSFHLFSSVSSTLLPPL